MGVEFDPAKIEGMLDSGWSDTERQAKGERLAG